MKSVLEKNVEKFKTHFIPNNLLFLNRDVYEIKWKNAVEPYRLRMTIQRTRISSWIPRATNARSEYVRPVTFLQQQWLHEHASVLRCSFIACLVDT
jgi:hypothetical protein